MRVCQYLCGRQAAFAVESAGFHIPQMLPILRILFVVHPLVARVKERHGAHVRRTLHIVLASQGVKAGGFAAHVPGEERQMNQAQ